jgi:phosphatidylinositol kinase/protein kinase (PI-3  family)
VEEQVEQVILNAISEDNLSKMYIGWMPWLWLNTWNYK